MAALLATVAVFSLATGCEALERAREADDELVAADQDDLSACRGGSCEVRVRESARIQVDGAGVVSLEIEAIEDDAVIMWLVSAEGEGPRVTCDHRSCALVVSAASLTEPAYVRSAVREGAQLTVNDLVVQVRSIAQERAVLHLTHANH